MPGDCPGGLGLTRRPPLWLGILVAAFGVAATTVLVFPLKTSRRSSRSASSTSSCVLLVATVWGAWLGDRHGAGQRAGLQLLPHPAHRAASRSPTARTGSAWPSFFVAAVLASSVAQLRPPARARGRAAPQEADLSAEMARLLLRGGRLEEALPAVGARLAQAMGLSSAAIELNAVDAGERSVVFPLREGSRQIGTLVCPRARRRRCCGASRCASRRRWRRCWPRRWSATRCRPRWWRPPRCAARRDQDRAAALGLARPALAAHRDPHRRRGAALAHPRPRRSAASSCSGHRGVARGCRG